MSLLLICILTLSIFRKGGCQLGDEQIPQFSFSSIDTVTINLPDSSGSSILRNETSQYENISSSTPLSITEVVSHQDSGTSTPPTIATPSRTTSLEWVNSPTAVNNMGVMLTPAESDRNTTLSTEATNTTAILSIALNNGNASLTTTATNTTSKLTTAATDTNVTSTTAATSLTAGLTTVATNTKPALTLAVDKINGHKENGKETKAPSVTDGAPTTQTPPATSVGVPPNWDGFADPDDLDYYYEDYIEEEGKPKIRGDMPRCRHDPCEHLQMPCLEVSQGTCLCPGLTPNSVAPGRPTTLSTQDVTDNSAEVRWCAPYSSVSGYELRVREKTGGALTSHDLDRTFRRFRLTGLRENRGYTVCVVAKNLAGSSPELCTELTTSRGVAVVTFALGAAVVALAVLALVLAVCLFRQCRKPPLQNQRNTSLVSIPNPAYCHPQETAGILKV